MTQDANREQDAEAPGTEPVRADGSGPAHNLLNLVQAVSGYIELIAVRTGDERSLGYLESAQRAVQEIAELAQSLARSPETKAPQSLGG